MTGTPSVTAIVNGAAALLGSTQRIRALDEGGTLAMHARDMWAGTVRAMLDAYPWVFAKKRVSVSASADAPPFGYTYAYALPADCLRWLPPSDEDGDAYFMGELESGRILTNRAAPLPITYISADCLDRVSAWPAYFAEAVEAAMAAKLAEPLTQSASTMRDMVDLADLRMKQARRRDALGNGNRSREIRASQSRWTMAARQPWNGGY